MHSRILAPTVFFRDVNTRLARALSAVSSRTIHHRSPSGRVSRHSCVSFRRCYNSASIDRSRPSEPSEIDERPCNSKPSFVDEARSFAFAESRHLPHSPPVLPSISSSTPQTLQTYLTHALSTSLSRNSTTYAGTLYELSTKHHLFHLSFNLTRMGGRGDNGIDLLGTWSLPSLLSSAAPTIRVLVQCKRLSRGASPNLIRELEGSFSNAPAGWKGDEAFGVLVCPRGATKGVRDAMQRSRRAMLWIMLEEISTTTHNIGGMTKASEEDENIYRVPRTRIRQFLYNAAAAKCGLQGLDVGMRYDGDGGDGEVQLQWRGRPLEVSSTKSDVEIDAINSEFSGKMSGNSG